MKGGTIRPWFGSSSGRGTPKNDDIAFSRVGVRKWIPNDDFYTIRVNCTNSSKGDVGGRVYNRGEDKVCGE